VATATQTAPRPVRRRRGRQMGTRTHQAVVGYVFILPILVFFAIFVAYPFVRSFYLSLTQWSGFGSPNFVGIRNFRNLMSDEVFWKALRDTVLFTAVTTVLQTVLPMLLSVLLNKGWRGSVLFRTLLFIPAIISFVVTGVLWQLLYDPNFGTLNEGLRAIGLGGLAHAWLAEPHLVLPALMLVSLWQSLGLFALIFIAGLQGIDPTLYEAARIDGATGWQQFRSITVPQLKVVTGVVITLNILNGLKVFDLIYVMTQGGPNHSSEVLGTYLYNLAFGSAAGGTPSLGYSTAISMIVFVLCMVATLVQFRISRERRVR
jgi:ABC-type sugar transport system permease subunit